MAALDYGLSNPFAAVHVITSLVEKAHKLEIYPFVSQDFQEFARQKIAVRALPASPMFDESLGRLTKKAFWLGARDKEGHIVSLQAYRLDAIDTSLAEWVVGWMAGLYMKRHELIVPAELEPPPNSRASKVRGRAVYHGEIWLSPKLKNREYFDTMPFLGMVLAYIKWNPDAMWGLVNDQMATHGYATRMKYPYIERSFLRWRHCPDGIPHSEWLVLAERDDLEYIIEECYLCGS